MKRIANALWVSVLVIMVAHQGHAGDYTRLVKKIQPAVVTVICYDMNRRLLRQGTGFFIDSKGHLITNYHVLRGAYTAEVKTHDGRQYPITQITAEDRTLDLMKVVAEISSEPISYLYLSKDSTSVGEPVLVVGSPMGLEQTVSEGIISAIRKVPQIGEIYQISAPISPGSSGSPVVNMKCDVIGVAAYRIIEGQNLNFAIPGKYVVDLKPLETPLTPSVWTFLSGLEEPGSMQHQKVLSKPPPPKPPIPPDFIKDFVTSYYADRDKFEVYVFKQIGGNPFDIDPMEEVRRTDERLPELFDHVFKSKISWSDRHKLNRDQARFWNDTVRKYRSDVYNRVVSRRKTMMGKYQWMMGKFDRAWEGYQGALKRYKEEPKEWEK